METSKTELNKFYKKVVNLIPCIQGFVYQHVLVLKEALKYYMRTCQLIFISNNPLVMQMRCFMFSNVTPYQQFCSV